MHILVGHVLEALHRAPGEAGRAVPRGCAERPDPHKSDSINLINTDWSE